MNFLSSSSDSEEEKPMGIKREYDLKDDDSSSSDEGFSNPKSTRDDDRIITDLSYVLSSVNLGGNKNQQQVPSAKPIRSTKLDTSLLEDTSDEDAVSPKKPIHSTKLDTSRLLEDSSDEDDESILRNYKSPFKTKYEPITLDDNSSLEGDKKSKTKKSKGPWRFSISKKEYAVSEISDSSMPTFRIPGTLFDRLYNHQKEGVAWMVGLHAEGVGGLLGDDMGMGKTYQTLTFLGGMMRARTIRNAIVVAPLTVLRSWEKEAHNVLKACVSNLFIKVVSSDIAVSGRQHYLRSALEW